MDSFDLKEWHVVIMFITILSSIFKSDVKSAINAFITIYEQKHLCGKNIFIASPSGSWDEVTIIEYKHMIPFVRGGGVIVSTKDPETGEKVKEKFSFSNWKSQRIRFP